MRNGSSLITYGVLCSITAALAAAGSISTSTAPVAATHDGVVTAGAERAAAPTALTRDCSHSLQTPMHAACVMPGTPDHVVAKINEYMWRTFFESQGEGQDGAAYFLGPRWTPGGQGDPTTLYWSVVPDGLFIPNGIGEGGGSSNLNAALSFDFEARLELVFDRWEELTGITFIQSSDDGATWSAPGPNNGGSNRGDIRIGGKPFGGGGILAYASFPNFGNIVVNTSINWNGFPGSNYLFFRNTLAHEAGHSIGLLHSCPQNSQKLMEPAINTNFNGPQLDDYRGAQRHYGDRLTEFGSSSNPVDLGVINDGQTASVDEVSIDDDSDIDWYQFEINANADVTIELAPFGWTYSNGPQNSNGSCSPGTPLNAAAVHDLGFVIFNSALEVVEIVDNTSAGQDEVLEDLFLSGPGTYLIRVAGSTASATQMYEIDVSVDEPTIPAPENNLCFEPEVVGDGTHDFTTVGASTDGIALPSECGGVDITEDIWYEYTATCTGTVTISTCGSADFDTRIAAYLTTSCPPSNSALVGCNDDGDGCSDGTSILQFDAFQSATYKIRLGGANETGTGTFTIECEVDEPDPCIGDLDDSGVVDGSDLATLLAAWGGCGDPDDCPADLDDSGTVDGSDLATLLAAWGSCP